MNNFTPPENRWNEFVRLYGKQCKKISFISLAVIGLALFGYCNKEALALGSSIESKQSAYDQAVANLHNELVVASTGLVEKKIDQLKAEKDLAEKKKKVRAKMIEKSSGDNTELIAGLSTLNTKILLLEDRIDHLETGREVVDILFSGDRVEKVAPEQKLEKQISLDGFHKFVYFLDSTRFLRYVRSYKVPLIQRVAKEKGILPQDLIAICMVEGFYVENKIPFGCRNEAVGPDMELGAFQIHPQHTKAYGYAQNFEKSLNFAADKLIGNGYSKTDQIKRKSAITRYNGDSDKGRAYSAKILKISDQVNF